MPSIFSKIIQGDIPSFKVSEDDKYFAFLDINPLVAGHTLVIPKLEVDNIFDMSAEDLGGLMKFAQPIAKAIEDVFPCDRCGFSVIGLEVTHAHLHLVPISSADDLNFTRPKIKLSPEQMQDCLDRIKRRL